MKKKCVKVAKKLINVLCGKTKKYENCKISGMYKDVDVEVIQSLIDKMISKHILLNQVYSDTKTRQKHHTKKENYDLIH